MTTTFDLLGGINASPAVRPMFNVGSLLDIPTGRFLLGIHGESILNGGIANVNAICGRGNSFKTALLLYMLLQAMDRYMPSAANVFDTELTLSYQRFADLSKRMMNRLATFDFELSNEFKLTDKNEHNGSEWFDWLKSVADMRVKLGKEHKVTTPFIDAHKKFIDILFPLLTAIDSFSMFETNVSIKMNEKGVGDSDRNMQFMKDGGAKTQLMMELPTVTNKGGIYVLMTAHLGDQHQLDPYAPPAKKLGFLKNKTTFKNVPEKFSFLTSNCLQVLGTAVLSNPTTKAPEFPRSQEDDLRNDTDLMILSVSFIRTKYGGSGIPFDLIVSQSNGLEVGLSEFWYIKSYGRYGIGGNDRTYHLDILPEVSLSRTTVRSKIYENKRLQRALEITSQLCQIQNLWHETDASLICTPKELYDSLIQKGYDWNRLLETRGYWTFNNESQPLPFLSTMDLLRMRVGLYHPYWY